MKMIKVPNPVSFNTVFEKERKYTGSQVGHTKKYLKKNFNQHFFLNKCFLQIDKLELTNMYFQKKYPHVQSSLLSCKKHIY
jgi:hypothetical protein